MNAGITANNIAYVTSDPLYAIVRFFASDQVAPVGVNGGGYKNPKVDALITEAKQTFDPAKQDELIAQAHALIVDDAALVWVVHDTNPHALSPKVKKFVQAQHWFQDLTTIGVEGGSPSSLRKQGPITTGRCFFAKGVGQWSPTDRF